MFKLTLSAAFVFLLSIFVVPAFAQDDEDAMVMQACKADIQQFCAGQTGDAAFDCLDDNFDKLSDACKQALDATDDGEEGEEGEEGADQEGEQQQ